MSVCNVDYIFTEIFSTLFYIYCTVTIFLNSLFTNIWVVVGNIVPVIIKHLIGYCNFYYQLGYGLCFYIYFYRRYRAKKTNNWQSFYGNSILNWVFFNLSVFNKFIFNRNFVVYIKTKLVKTYKLLNFLISQRVNTNTTFIKIRYSVTTVYKNYVLNIWTPLFKRSSYISFLTFLKRFTKRK